MHIDLHEFITEIIKFSQEAMIISDIRRINGRRNMTYRLHGNFISAVQDLIRTLHETVSVANGPNYIYVLL